jgi:hypothetical protein
VDNSTLGLNTSDDLELDFQSSLLAGATQVTVTSKVTVTLIIPPTPSQSTS